MNSLRSEIKQSRPFSSLEEEIVLSMLRTADQLAAPLNEFLRQSNLSLSQYNVLRILRGAGDEGLPCGEISERMVRRDPDLTRLLDRLEARDLVTRTRSSTDRRVVLAMIAPAGRDLLNSLDSSVDETVRQTLGHMSRKDMERLVELLELARGSSQ